MTVKELRGILDILDGDMEVVIQDGEVPGHEIGIYIDKVKIRGFHFLPNELVLYAPPTSSSSLPFSDFSQTSSSE